MTSVAAERLRLLHPSRLRRRLAVRPAAAPPEGKPPFRAQARRFTTAQTLVRAFYAFVLYAAVARFADLLTYFNRTAPALLWPVAWLGRAGHAGPYVLITFYLATNVLGVFTAPWRFGRALTFLGLLEFVAYQNSFGKIGHSWHLLLFVAGVFILLPGGWDRPTPRAGRRLRQETLLIFWLAQAAVLMSYTMSGVGKLAAALGQLAAGQPNAFAPGGLAAVVAQRLIETRSTSVFGAWIVRHPYLTWPALPAAIGLETFALAAAFRPALARPWGLALIGLHAGIYLTMTINFPQNCFLLALFLVASPFEPEGDLTWQTRLLAVPFVPSLHQLWQTARRPRDVLSR